jgi:hypothetical protein
MNLRAGAVNSGGIAAPSRIHELPWDESGHRRQFGMAYSPGCENEEKHDC